MNITRPELAALLAGLRLLQEGMLKDNLHNDIRGILDCPGGPWMTPKQLDDLCARLNAPPASATPPKSSPR